MPEFDPRTPSIARVYDYLLGGKDNFAADREMATGWSPSSPRPPTSCRRTGSSSSRAVTWVANQGVGQFIDLGCGLPTTPNTHETAQAVAPECAGGVRRQ